MRQRASGEVFSEWSDRSTSEKCMHNADRDVTGDVAMPTHAGKAANLLLFIPASAAGAGREASEKGTTLAVRGRAKSCFDGGIGPESV